MSVRYYLCEVWGNGDPDAPPTPTTGAYRPAIVDVVDPVTGGSAFATRAQIGVGPDGTPLHSWTLVAAQGDQHGLAVSAPGVEPMPDPGLRDVQLASIHLPTRNAMLARLTARGIDVSWVSTETGYRDVCDRLVSLHVPAFNSDALDFPT